MVTFEEKVYRIIQLHWEELPISIKGEIEALEEEDAKSMDELR